MVGHNLPPLIEIGLIKDSYLGLMYISENLGKAAALPALPLIMPLDLQVTSPQIKQTVP